MNTLYKITLIITAIFVTIFVITFGIFGFILYKKYSYLFKVIRKMENDKYLWPINKKISQGIVSHVNKKGSTLLIGVGSCSILDHLVKKMDPKYKIDVIDSNKYLLELAEEKYGDKCNYINDDFMLVKLEKCYDNIISTLPFKEFNLSDIERIFEKYFSACNENIVFFESKMPHVKNSYVKMLIENKNKSITDSNGNYKWELNVKKNYSNIPPINLCILKKTH